MEEKMISWVQIPPPALLSRNVTLNTGWMKLEEKFERLYELFNNKAPEKHPVFQAAKIAEETGEAINLVFKFVGFRRESYNIEDIKEKLADELADVVITTFTCAKVCGIDLWKAIDKKLDVEIRRWEEFKS
jgi:NTP pyrophosphatase (non-canonical NTP hydrolase)